MEELIKDLVLLKSKINEIRYLKMECVRRQKWENAAEHRDEEKKLEEKVKQLNEKIDSEFKNLPLVERARIYAIKLHEDINQLYDGRPYSYHLESVVKIAKKFIKNIPKEMAEDVLSACYSHDLLEDTSIFWTDIKNVLNEHVADLVYAVTNEKGKTRKERANNKYYEGIRNEPYATFIKLCDRISNIEYSLLVRNNKLKMYVDEYEHFRVQLHADGEYDDMWDHLEDILVEFLQKNESHLDNIGARVLYDLTGRSFLRFTKK